MSFALQYHIVVRHSILPTASFSLLVLILIFSSTSQAQINGAPASVTSPGFGGRALNGPPASVTSLGPRGFAPNARALFFPPRVSRNGDRHPHRRHNAEYGPSLVYGIPVPYAVDMDAADEDVAPGADDNYQGGPTIFDRRGSGASSYVPPVTDVSAPHSANAEVSVADPDPPQEPTLLIFKDGSKLELGNYAIVGQTVFDLTPGHARKIPLANLDLEATRQQNEDRGITFQLPPSSQAN